MLRIESVQFAGRGLSRPECVLCTRDGDVFVSHMGKGILHIAPDGSQHIIGDTSQVDGQPWIPNGFALLPDRTFLVANMGEGGGVWRLHRSGVIEPFLREVDGQHLRAVNFVLVDHIGRVWISVTTRQWPLAAAFKPGVADGYIAVVDHKGARIVADGLAFTNELRLDETGQFLYVVETFGRHIRRFCIAADGRLTHSEIFTSFGHGTLPDGIAFDSDGHLWVTSIISNRLIRVDRDGQQTIILEEADTAHIDHIERQLAAGTLTRDDILQTPANLLKNISSIAFGGPDLRRIYLGSLGGGRLPVFQSPVAGLAPSHWHHQF